MDIVVNDNDIKTETCVPNEEKQNRSEPPSKKIKLSNSETTEKFPLFTHESPNIDTERTLIELHAIPLLLDEERKEKYLLNKFLIAADVIDEYDRIQRFGERMVSFMDKQNNICLITDNYRVGPINHLISNSYFEECNVEIYHNTVRTAVGKELWFGSGDHKFEMHRTYVLILRAPYTNFVERFNNSFEQFLIESANIFYSKTSQYFQDPNHFGKFQILHLVKYFYKCCVEFNRKSVLLSPLSPQSYGNLFSIYHEMQHRFQWMVSCDVDYDLASIYPVFTILYELYDKPWIKLQKIDQCIKSCWNQIGQKSKFEYFESEIAKCIIQFVHNSEGYDFEDFIQKQMNLDGDGDGFEVTAFYGQYTHIYEEEHFLKENIFLLNPFKWKYLEIEKLQNVKNDLIEYKTEPFNFWCTMAIIGREDSFSDVSNRLTEFDSSDQITLNHESWKLFEEFDLYLNACIKVFHPWTDNL